MMLECMPHHMPAPAQGHGYEHRRQANHVRVQSHGIGGRAGFLSLRDEKPEERQRHRRENCEHRTKNGMTHRMMCRRLPGRRFGSGGRGNHKVTGIGISSPLCSCPLPTYIRMGNISFRRVGLDPPFSS